LLTTLLNTKTRLISLNSKFQIQKQLLESKSIELEAQAKIVLAETQGSSLQRNWRPMLMVTFGGLVVAHWFGFTASKVPESVKIYF